MITVKSKVRIVGVEGSGKVLSIDPDGLSIVEMKDKVISALTSDLILVK